MYDHGKLVTWSCTFFSGHLFKKLVTNLKHRSHNSWSFIFLSCVFLTCHVFKKRVIYFIAGHQIRGHLFSGHVFFSLVIFLKKQVIFKNWSPILNIRHLFQGHVFCGHLNQMVIYLKNDVTNWSYTLQDPRNIDK